MMLATKNWAASATLFLAACGMVVLLSGCSPPGTHAFLEGDRLLREGKYEKAIEKLKVATELLAEGQQPRAWNHLGLAYHHAGRTKEAIDAYRKALDLNRNQAVTPVTHFNLGCLYLDQNNLPEAISELNTYIVLNTNEVSGCLKLGAAYLRSRKFDAAEKSYLEAWQRNHASPETLNGLGLVQFQRKDLRKAEACFRAALKEQPRYGPALLNLAIVYHQHANNANYRQIALRTYRDYLELRPRPPNSSAVEEIVRKIEAELNPPPRVAQTNPPPSVPRISLAPPPMSNLVSSPAAAGSLTTTVASLSTQTKTPLTKPASATEQQPVRSKSILEAPPNVAERAASPSNTPTTTPPPARPNQNEAPPSAKLEVVTLTNEPAPKLPEEVLPSPPRSATNMLAADPSDTSAGAASPVRPLPPLASRIKPKSEPWRFLDRLNPRAWFRGKEATAPLRTQPQNYPATKAHQETEAQPMAKLDVPPTTAAIPPPAAVSVPRYTYHSHAKLTAGDRGKAEPYFAAGLKAHHERKLAGAIESYREAIKLDQSYFEAHYNLGLAAFEIGDLPQSLNAYEVALVLVPASADARYNFALALERAGYFRDAANELETMLSDRPADPKAHFALAKLYAERLAQASPAREHYQRVLKLDPRHPEATAIRYWLAAHP